MSNNAEPNFYSLMLGLPENLGQPNHYQLLDVDPFSSDTDTIREAAAAQNGKLMTWQNSKYFKEAGQLMLELAQARAVLLDPDKRQAYDQRLGLISVDEEPVILLEPDPEENPIVLDPVGVPPARNSPPNRRRTRTRRPSASRTEPAPQPSAENKSLSWAVLSGCVFSVLGLSILGWSAWNGESEPPPIQVLKESSDNAASPDLAETPQSDKLDNETEKPVSVVPVTNNQNAPPVDNQDTVPVRTQDASDPPPLAVAPFDTATATQHQTAWAKHLKVPVETTNNLGMKLRLIPPGEFQMGSPPDERLRNGSETQHPVRLTKPFYAGVKEVTLAEFKGLLPFAPSSPAGEKFNTDPNLPVLRSTWHECIYFCNQLSLNEGLQPYYSLSDVTQSSSGVHRLKADIQGGNGYRLPTEAEWEYMCRAGTETAFHFGDALPENSANFRGSDSPPGSPVTSQLKLGGSFPANAFGLYDMHGNLSEWCFDTMRPYAPRPRLLVDPLHTLTPNHNHIKRIFRGGNYTDFPADCRSAARNFYLENYRGAIGFRVVRTISPAEGLATNRSKLLTSPMNGGQPALAQSPFDANEAKQHQAAWANHLGIAVTEETQDGIELHLIPAGEFRMGSPLDEPFRINTETPHSVRLTEPFYLGTKEITIEQFRRIQGQGNPTPRSMARLQGRPGSHAMEDVTWFEAVNFCNQLSQREGFSPYYAVTNIVRDSSGVITGAEVSIQGGEGYRLPTEAEWEFACRAGTETPWHVGSQLLPGQAHIRPDGGATSGRPTTVASYLPNAFGLYDMHGNVLEWCFDYMDFRFYSSSPLENPIKETPADNMPASRLMRTVRGGSYLVEAKRCRSAIRSGRPPDFQVNVGIRVARTPKPKSSED